MFTRIQSFVRQEREYFAKLSPDEKRLLVSFLLFNLAAPLTNVFSVTYLWRASGGPVAPILFTLLFFAGLSVGFFMNVYLLKFYRSKHLYIFSCLLAGIIPFALVSLKAISESMAGGAGLLLGISLGLYWANRHFLIALVIEKTHRFFFISLMTALAMYVNIIAPFAIGWVLVAGEYLHLYSSQSAYITTMFVGFLLFLMAGGMLGTFSRKERIIPSSILPHQSSKTWRMFNGMQFVSGLMDGIEAVVPVFLILIFLGQEESVGTVLSLTALVSASLLYSVGRKMEKHREFELLTYWSLFASLGGILLFFVFGKIGLILYFVSIGLVRAFRWASAESIMYRLIDSHIRQEEDKFAYILSRESALNLGRIFSLGFLLALLALFPESALRMSILYIVLLQIPFLILLRKVYQAMHPLDSTPVSR